MSDEKVLERGLALVQSLHKRTQEGRVDWQDSGDARSFRTDIGDFDLIIRQIPDPDYPDEPNYSLEIVEKGSGRVIEAISNVTLRPVMDRKTAEGLNPYAVLDDTFQMARRKALKIDDVLENILHQLQAPGE
jgi:hypothetical protein